ncbi:MAG TPA: tetratricopeptide repeat protein [Thermoanaerobaculia bacterium]|nr:tetratricopeptide repeat protein [Thermoanaerobaculia bacterium]
MELAKLLTEAERDPAVEVYWEKGVLDFGDGTPRHVSVDDLIVFYRSGKWRFSQIKKAGTWTMGALIGEKVAQLLWQQWQEATTARVQIRLRLATGGTIRAEPQQIIKAAETAKTPAELTGSLGARAQQDLKQLAAALSAGEGALLAFLKVLEIDGLQSAEQVHNWTVQELRPLFGERASELAERLERIVARSKQSGEAARTQHTRDSLTAQLEAEDFSCEVLRRRRAVPLRAVAMGVVVFALAVMATPFIWPTDWHRLVGTQAAILPLTTWVGSPLHPLTPSLVDLRTKGAQLLTSQLANQIEQASAIRPLGTEVAAAIAKSVAWDGRPCVRMEALEQIQRLTGVDYVVTGSFDFPDKPNTLTTCLQRTVDGEKTVNTWRLGSTVMEVVGRDLNRHLGFSLASFRAWLSGRQKLYTRSPDALTLWVDGMKALQDFDMLGALRNLDKATKIDPYFYPAHYTFSQVLQERGRDEAAQAEATTALQIFEDQHGGDRREHTLLQAQDLAAKGELHRAVDLYLRLWHAEPSDFQAALHAVETQNLAERSDEALNLVDQIRNLQQQQSDAQLPPDIDIRLDLEEAEAAGQAENFSREERAAKAALAKLPRDHSRLEARAWFLACDAVVQQQEAQPRATQIPWPPECTSAKKSFQAGDLINYGKLLQLEARSLRASDPSCALAKDRLTVDVFRAAQFERGLVDQLTNLVDTLTEPPIRVTQYAEAGLRCNEALEKACDAGSLHLPEVLTDCAYIYTMTGNLKLAEDMYTDASSIARQRKDASSLAATEGNLAYIEHALGRPLAADPLYKDSLAISAHLGESEAALAETRVRYARLLLDLGNEARARDLFKSATSTMTAQALGTLLADMKKVLAKSPNGAAWERIAVQPSPPVPPPAPRAKNAWQCTNDEPVVPSRPDPGAAIPSSTRSAVVQPLGRILKSCKNLPLPPLQIPKGYNETQ